MKKIIVAALAASALVMAGGNIAPVEAPVVEAVEAEKDFYVGISTTLGDSIVQDDFEAFTSTGYGLQAGYTFYRNEAFEVAIEGRYMAILSGSFDNFGDVQTYGAFIKPGYDFGGITAYGLIGYAAIDRPNIDTDGFAYGGGLSADVYGYEIFVDYVTNDADNDIFNAFEPDFKNEQVTIGMNYRW